MATLTNDSMGLGYTASDSGYGSATGADPVAAPASAPASYPSPDAQPSRPTSLETMRRTTIEQPAIGEKPIKEIRAEPRPQPREQPAEPTVATRLAAAHRAERAAREAEARAARAEEQIRQRTLAALPAQARAQYLAAEDARVQRNYYAEAVRHVESDPESYPMTHALGWQNQVPQVIHAYWEQHHKILSHQQAARYVENEIRQKWKALDDTPTAKALRAQATRGDAQRPARAPDWTDRRPLTEAERMRRAAAVMQAITSRSRKG